MRGETTINTENTGYKGEVAGMIIGSVAVSAILVWVVIVFAKRRGYSWAT